jgi:hypothetical protein
MTQRHYTNALAEVSLKWRDLAERRRAHLVELYDTGRWKRYYEEDQFLKRDARRHYARASLGQDCTDARRPAAAG